ncbi:ATP-binding protein [Streptomyces sp. NPDC008343]|uniref:ATP-binding protein n=1 Tax=Streptomyces sp. NPDC008343 TaxID=3364828 RepID=UPI0036F0F4A6
MNAVVATVSSHSTVRLNGLRGCPGGSAAGWSWELPHRHDAVGVARSLAASVMEDWDMTDDSVDQALLVVSELVTNALEHAMPPVVLFLDRSRDGMVRVRVDDGGPSPVEGRWVSSCSREEHGRGQTIIGILALDQGAGRNSHGATHWAVLSGPTAA